MIPTLVAHRGYMEKYPENTLSALEAALEAGACMIEFDIQMDAGSQLLLLHDDDFKRTAGVDASVFQTRDYQDISVHEPGRLGQAYSPEPVPLLDQALKLLLRYPRATAFVEIKEESLDYWGLERVMDALLSCLQPAGQQCVIISDNLDALLYTVDRSDYRVGWVIHRYDQRHRQLAEIHQPDYLICNYQRIGGDLWQGRWQWMLYDISDPELAIHWAEKGSALIETRDIGAMLQHPLLLQRRCKP